MRKIFLVALVLLSANAAAAELGDYCWYVAPGKLMRLSINEVGPGHFTLMGKFQSDQGGDYEINGHVRTEGGTLVGSFSGAVSARAYT